jgi:hypothetical protein
LARKRARGKERNVKNEVRAAVLNSNSVSTTLVQVAILLLVLVQLLVIQGLPGIGR